MKPHPIHMLVALLAFAAANDLPGQGTAFTYQGELQVAGQPANGSYDIKFTVYDASSAGNVVTGPLTNSATSVASGLFSVTLDFGPGVFTGPLRWLEMGARVNGGGAFVTLSPRQELTPTPYAIMANSASNLLGSLPATQLSGTVSSSQIAGTYSGQVTLNNPLNVICGDGGCLTNVNASTLGGLSAGQFWQLTGNGGTTAGVNFVGTTDNQPLELHVNAVRAFRLEPTASGAPNVLGGSHNNAVASGVYSATISGGDQNLIQASSPVTTISGGLHNTIQAGCGNSVVGGGASNTNGAYDSTIAGGNGNTIQAGAHDSTIGGGYVNKIQPSADTGTIAGGAGNNIGTNASGSTIAGGLNSSIQAYSQYSTIGGGLQNVIQALYATVSGGYNNEILTDSSVSTIAGGNNNVIYPNAVNSSISGGQQNTVQTNASYSGIVGGRQNSIADTYSFVGAGTNNTIQIGASASAIAGGSQNTIESSSAYSTIGGGANNTIQTNASRSTIGGGANNFVATAAAVSTIGGGQRNSISNLFSVPFTGAGCVICGGEYNTIGGGDDSTIAGGYGNQLGTNADEATICGGDFNRIQDNASHAVISGGSVNLIATGCEASTIGGGDMNEVLGSFPGGAIVGGLSNQVSGSFSMVGCGFNNTVDDGYSIIGGGWANTIQFGATYSFIGGGYANTIQNDEGGGYAVIPGGFMNTATNYAFAAGTLAQATNTGAFVWADYQDQGFVFGSINSDEFAVRATGGVRFVTSLDSSGNPSAGVFMSPGDTSWSSISDRNAKKNITPVNGQAVLEALARVPVERWNYKWESDDAVPHLGPMAQDFKRAFFPGRDETRITTLEFDGVELAAIQGLNQKVDGELATLREELKRRDSENRELKARLETLERTIKDYTSQPKGREP